MYHRTHSRDRRRGTALVLTVSCLMGLTFLSAITIDCSNQMSTRRHLQNVSDAASLAACVELAKLRAAGSTPTQSQLQGIANQCLANNGYTNGTNCTVTVIYPPTSGNYQNDKAVEVNVTSTYSNLIVRGSNNVSVRSVATSDPAATGSFSMTLLEPTQNNAFWVKSGSLTLADVPIQVNSSGTTASVVEGMANSRANASIRAVGGSSGSSSAFNPAVKGGYTPKANPYAALPMPTTTGMTTYTQSMYNPNSSNQITLNPGYYPNGLYVINGGNVTLNPGLYYVEGGNLWINTPGTVSGNGVTLYYNSGNSSRQVSYGGMILCPSVGDYTITPPTTGTYKGISLMQNPSCTLDVFYDFWGNHVGDLNVGTQYFPGASLRCWTKYSGDLYCNELVANKFRLVGYHEMYGNTQNGGFSTLTWHANTSSRPAATDVALVE